MANELLSQAIQLAQWTINGAYDGVVVPPSGGGGNTSTYTFTGPTQLTGAGRFGFVHDVHMTDPAQPVTIQVARTHGCHGAVTVEVLQDGVVLGEVAFNDMELGRKPYIVTSPAASGSGQATSIVSLRLKSGTPSTAKLHRSQYTECLLITDDGSVDPNAIYVNAQATTNGTGTVASPFNSIDSAVAAAEADVTKRNIYLEGTFPAATANVGGLTTPAYGLPRNRTSESQRLWIRSKPGSSATIDCGDVSQGFGASDVHKANFVTLYDLDINNVSTATNTSTGAVAAVNVNYGEVEKIHCLKIRVNKVTGGTGSNSGGFRMFGIHGGNVWNCKVNDVKMWSNQTRVSNANCFGWQSFRGKSNSITQCVFSDLYAGIYQKQVSSNADDSYTSRFNYFNQTEMGCYSNISGGLDPIPSFALIEQNFFYKNSVAAFTQPSNTSKTPEAERYGMRNWFVNNTCIGSDSGASDRGFIQTRCSKESVLFNNIFVGGKLGFKEGTTNANNEAILYADHNVWFVSGDALNRKFYYNNVKSFTTLAQWQALGFGANSSFDDPNLDLVSGKLPTNSALLTAGLGAKSIGMYLSGNEQIGNLKDNVTTNPTVLLSEGFETGQMPTNVDAGSVNTVGFRWTSSSRTSIVNATHVIWNGNVISVAKPAGRDWTPLSGNNSLRFRYQANQSMTEQRFALQPQNDVWMEYSFRVPINYSHDNANGGAANNKFISIWMDGYEGAAVGSTYWLSMERGADATKTNLAWTYSPGNNAGSLGMRDATPFIDANTDRGKWFQVRIHLRNASSNTASDGQAQVWIKKGANLPWVQFHNDTAVPFRSPATRGFAAGYFFGWANGQYANDTEFLMDDLKLYDGGFPSQDAVNNPVTDRTALWYHDDYQNAAIGATLNSASSGAWSTSPGKIANDPKNIHGKVIEDVMPSGKSEWASGGILDFGNFTLSKGNEAWYQFKMLIPAGASYASNPHFKFVRFRTKNQDGTHAGYFDLYLEPDGDWKLIFEGNYSQGQGGWVHLTTDQSKKPVLDQWETYEIHVVFDDVTADAGGSAKIEFWKNNELIGSVTNMQTLKTGGTVTSIYNRTYWNGGAPQAQSLFWCESAAAIKSATRDDSVHLITDAGGNKFIGGGMIPSVQGNNGLSSTVPVFSDNYDNDQLNSTSELTYAPFNRTSVANGALNVTYRAGVTDNSIQGVTFSNARSEIWLYMRLVIPDNFSHGADNKNNKLLAIWMDGYSQHGLSSTVIWEYWGDSSNPGNSRLSVHFSEGNNVITGPHLQHFDFINATSDRGKYMDLVFHVKAATNTTSNDGVIKLHVKKEGQATYQERHSITNANMPIRSAAPNNGWKHASLMGWNNSAYAADTVFKIDELKLYDQSPLPV